MFKIPKYFNFFEGILARCIKKIATHSKTFMRKCYLCMVRNRQKVGELLFKIEKLNFIPPSPKRMSKCQFVFGDNILGWESVIIRII